MATNWLCPIDGLVPGDAGTATSGSGQGPDQTKGNSQVATYRAENNEWIPGGGTQGVLTSALGDFNGLPPHCPVCGCAMVTASATFVTTVTGVASGSQHPADLNATYGAMADSPLAQYTGAGTVYSRGTYAAGVYPHAYTAGQGSAHTVTRGTSTVTAETVNATQGP